ncbi:Mitochondrial F1F0-ATP synthase, subunit OSCP/ATP5 [Handroanthus impetiginosus]|uniref:Mitochondrial F1F0-ATP synthase, subunit OSCP/ATP5 n=1 Tax=Handroanthus impetiginosus TaxID=429701 RepID=A0A2G9IBQ8_9LAMI|nr:Mitochondrial F1F0-ATP synthase, subunit OSCP/ATP5 [Handroanthus impetiginosus]
MAMAGRLRSGLPLLRQALATADRSVSPKAVLCPTLSNPEVPLTMFGVPGNYASALYISAVKANVLDKVESELLSLVKASKRSSTFSQFMKDLSVTADTRVKAINDICAQAKFSEITKNFLRGMGGGSRGVLAVVGLLFWFNIFVFILFTQIQNISKLSFVAHASLCNKWSKDGPHRILIMALRGEVKATVTSVIPLPEQEEKELKETLQNVLGQGKQVKLEQKIDPNILGGLVEFGQKVFDMSIKTRAAQMERLLCEPISLDSK